MLGAAGLLFVLAVAYWLGADAIPKSRLGGAVGADGLPKLLAVTLGLLSAALALQTVGEARKRRKSGDKGGLVAIAQSATNWTAHVRAFGVVVIGIGFLVLLPVLGYVFSVALLLMTIATYTGKRPSLTTVVFGAAGAAVFYLLFVKLLQVPLPSGFWPSLFA